MPTATAQTFFSLEQRVVLGLVRRFLGRNGAEMSLPTGDIDWLQVTNFARNQGVLAIVYAGCSEAERAAMPAAILEAVRNESRDLAFTNMRRAAELCRLVKLLQSWQVCAMPFKGPLLTQTLYNNLALRAFCDLDVLCPNADLAEVARRLVANGYRQTDSLELARPDVYLRTETPVHLMQENSDTLIELHPQVSPRLFAFRLRAEALRRRAVPVTFAGCNMMSLAPEDLLLVLCSHGAKHMWSRLIWLCDVDRLIAVHPQLDWQYVWRQARHIRNRRILLLALVLANHLLATPVPPWLLCEAASDRHVAWLAKQACLGMASGAVIGPWQWWRLAARLFDQAADSVRMQLSTVFVPTTADGEAVRLPPHLFFFYYPLRLCRLSAKYLLRFLSRHACCNTSQHNRP